MFRKYLLFLNIVILSVSLVAQNQRIDSLLKELNKVKEDTIRVDILSNLCWEFKSIDSKKAAMYGERGLELAKKINFIPGMGACYNNLGLVSMNLGNYDEANKFLQLSLEARKGLGEKRNMAVCLNNMGLIYYYQSNYSEAIERYQSSLKIMEELKDSIGIAKCYENIGLIHWKQNDNKKAISYYEKALQLHEMLKNKTGICGVYMNIGGVYFNNGDYKNSLDYSKKSLKLYEELGSIAGMASSNMAIGLSYANLSEFNLSIEYYKKSMELYEKIENKNGLSWVLGNIAELYIRTEKYKEAEEYVEKSLKIAKEIGSLENQKMAYYYLAVINENLKNYQKANDNNKLYKLLNDSIFNIESSKQIKELEAIYQDEKKQKEIELLEKDKKLKSAELERQTLQKYFFIIGFILMLIFSIVIFKSYRDKKKANTLLAEQKLEIEDKNEELNQQNEEIIAQRDEIEAQRDMVTAQKQHIEEIHKDLTDSINYAERIQRSFLATKELLDTNLKEYFIFFHPKDVVSGDFYWASKLNNGNFALATADSTGHGVPGAIMSILNITSLEKAVEQGICDPSEILNKTRNTIIDRLKKDGSTDGGKDGMDASLICFDFVNKKFTYSAANNPIWVIRENNIIELAPDKMPVGKHDKDSISFTQEEFQLRVGDVVYTLTDGLPDQFGGPKGKKFKYAQLKELLLTICMKEMPEQKRILENTLQTWKGDLEQIDDITILGMKI